MPKEQIWVGSLNMSVDTSHLNMQHFLHHTCIIPWKIRENVKKEKKKAPHITTLKENPGSLPLSRSTPKVNGVYLWAKTHQLSKSDGNQFRSFCVILLTNQPTNGHKQKRIITKYMSCVCHVFQVPFQFKCILKMSYCLLFRHSVQLLSDPHLIWWCCINHGVWAVSDVVNELG